MPCVDCAFGAGERVGGGGGELRAEVFGCAREELDGEVAREGDFEAEFGVGGEVLGAGLGGGGEGEGFGGGGGEVEAREGDHVWGGGQSGWSFVVVVVEVEVNWVFGWVRNAGCCWAAVVVRLGVLGCRFCRVYGRLRGIVEPWQAVLLDRDRGRWVVLECMKAAWRAAAA